MENNEVKSLQFHQIGLDDRLLEAIARCNWKEPTPIQEKAIPIFLQGKDILARSRTGSGKTGAFLIPLIHMILERRMKMERQITSALILAPSKELCKQIMDEAHRLTSLCQREIKIINLSEDVPIDSQKTLLQDFPDIVIGSPLRIMNHINKPNFSQNLQFIIIDEADLMFAYKYRQELDVILRSVPSICQSFITSATLPNDVQELRSRVLRNAVTIQVDEPPLPSQEQLDQYILKMDCKDKVIVLYAFLKLGLIKGKMIIFVKNIVDGYKLRIFLDIFGIKSCILNPEMPCASRCHVIDDFNQNKYNILIASDISSAKKNKPIRSLLPNSVFDPESGANRGLDFRSVNVVLNFDFPTNIMSYVHRVGRTARGSMKGTALSFVSQNDYSTYQEVEEELKRLTPGNDFPLQEYKFNLDSLSGFRYRAMDVWERCTFKVARELILKELKDEILNSKKLQTYFKDHPEDKKVIRHDLCKTNNPLKLHHQKHLKNVPSYNVPSVLRKVSALKRNAFLTPSLEDAKIRRKWKSAGKKKNKKSLDPLRTLTFMGINPK